MTVVVQHPEYHGDAWDRLAKAVNIGTSIYGLKLETDKYELNKKMQEAEERRKVRAEEIANRQRRGEYMAGELPQVLKETGSSFSRQLPDKPNLSHLGIPYKAGKRDDYIKSKLGDEQIYITKDAPIVKPNKSTSINVGAKLEKITESQGKAALHAISMEQAHKTLEVIEKQYPDYDPATILNASKNGRIYPELLKDEVSKRYFKASQRYINAILRHDSGAAITEDEFRRYLGMYSVNAGDTAEVKEDNRQQRIQEIEAMKVLAGSAYEKSMKNIALNPESKRREQTSTNKSFYPQQSKPWNKKW